MKWICAGCDKSDKLGEKIESLFNQMMEKFVDRNTFLESMIDSKADESLGMMDSKLKDQQHQFEKQLMKLENSFNKKFDEMSIKVCNNMDSVHSSLQKKTKEEVEITKTWCGVEKKVDKMIAVVEKQKTNSHELHDNKLLEVQEAISKKLDEDKDIESRRSNIIIYRVPEERKATTEERKNADKSFVSEMCEEVFGVTIGKEDITKQFRLGTFTDDDKVRPLLVSFNDPNKKEMILKNLRNLKMCGDKFKAVSIAHDLTPRQRRTVHELLEEARKDQKNNSDVDKENFKFIVVGAHKRPRVIKIKQLSI